MAQDMVRIEAEAAELRGVVTYTDGSRVQAGDRIRYHQAPGGLMAPGPWRYGVAVESSGPRHPCLADGAADLVLQDDENGYQYGLLGHVIERA